MLFGQPNDGDNETLATGRAQTVDSLGGVLLILQVVLVLVVSKVFKVAVVVVSKVAFCVL